MSVGERPRRLGLGHAGVGLLAAVTAAVVLLVPANRLEGILLPRGRLFAQAPAPPSPPSGGHRPATEGASARPCDPTTPCCPKAIGAFCRVGCPGPLPKKTVNVQPDMSAVAEPFPRGVVIIELAVDERGVPVSACVLRGVRPDVDRAAQFATLGWRFEPMIAPPASMPSGYRAKSSPDGHPIGFVMTATVAVPPAAVK